MKRRYVVSVAVVAEFDRKATNTAKEAKAHLLAAANALGQPWAIRSAAITSTAKPAKPPAPAPSPRQQQVDMQLEVLRGILNDLATVMGNVKTPRLHIYPNRWCMHYPTYGAHSHSKGRLKGLICVTPKEVLDTITPTMDKARSFRIDEQHNLHPQPRTDPVWLMAHELNHIRMPGGSHNRKAFRDKAKDLEDKYHAWKAGTWQPPVRVPGWAKAKSRPPNTSQP